MSIRIIEAETFDQRIESKLSWQDKNHKASNVEAIVTKPEGARNYVKEWYFGGNWVTLAGQTYYAQRGTGGNTAVTNDFGHATNSRIYLRTSADTPAQSDTWELMTGVQTDTNKAPTATYPKQNDGDTDNTGRGVYVCTYCYNWATGDFNRTGIQGGGITATSSPTTGTPLLNHFSITSFDKTGTDTLKLFVNHTFAGQSP